MKNRFFLLSLLFAFLLSNTLEAQTTYTWNNFTGSAGATWGTPTNWSPNGIPKAGDSVVLTVGTKDVFIQIDTNRTVRGISFTSTNKDLTVNMAPGVTLTVTHNITFNTVSANGTQLFNIGSGAIVCDSIIMQSQGNANRVNAMTISNGSLTCKHIVMASCARCDVANTITMTGAGTLAVGSSITGGTLSGGNDGTIDLGSSGTISFSGTTGIQTVPAGSYPNMKITGGGSKKLGGSVVVNAGGKLKWSGNSTLDTNGFTLSYGANSTLVYEDTTNAYKYSTGNEWPNTNPPTKVTVNLTGTSNPTVTMGANKTISDTLNLVSGSLGLNNKTLTLNGKIVGAGKLSGNGTSSNLTIGGTGAFGTIYMNQDTAGVTNRINNLTFNRTSSGTLALGDSMQIIGVVTPTAGTLTTNGKLVIAATSSSTYGQVGPFVSGGAISGNVKIEKVFASVLPGWRQICLPAQDTVSNIKGLQVQTTANPKINQRSVFWWDASLLSNKTAKGWTTATNSDGNSKGYSVYNNNANVGVHEISTKISVAGALAQSDYTINLENNWDKGPNGTSIEYGWNLIPNRFASNIDVGNLIRDANFAPSYKAVHVWDRASNQFIGINGSSLIVYNTNATGLDTSKNIAPWQAFWVKADSVLQSIQVKNIHRTTSMANVTIFMKSAPDFMRLNIADNNGNKDQVAVQFAMDASEDFEGDKDLYKLRSLSTEVPTLYIKQGTHEQSATVVPYIVNRTVNLVLEAAKDNEQYTFSPDFDNFSYNGEVILEDLKTETLTDLRSSHYQFKSDSSFKGQRFLLHFHSNTSSTHQDLNKEKTYVYSGENGIEVFFTNNGSQKPGKVSIYNVLGQEIYHNDNVVSGENIQFKPESNTKQVYMVNIISNGISKTHKIIF